MNFCLGDVQITFLMVLALTKSLGKFHQSGLSKYQSLSVICTVIVFNYVVSGILKTLKCFQFIAKVKAICPQIIF